jgi:prolyl oligopeptidase family protein
LPRPPLLLIHSRTDSAVPYEQSLQLKARYQELGRPVELITLTDAPQAFWNFSRWFPGTMDRAVDFFVAP